MTDARATVDVMAARSRRVSVPATKSRKKSSAAKRPFKSTTVTASARTARTSASAPPPSRPTTTNPTDDAPAPLTAESLPPFPTRALPSWLRAWTEAQSEALQVPADLPALLSLAVVSTPCAKRHALTVRDSWVEPLNLFTLVAMPSGTRKSVLFEAATRPLVAFERASRACSTSQRTLTRGRHSDRPRKGHRTHAPMDRGLVDASTVADAIAVGRYAAEHAKTAFGIAGADQGIEGANTVLAWPHRVAFEEVTRRDIHQAVNSHFPNIADLDHPIDVLVERRWLRTVDEPVTRTRGRPSSTRYRLHGPIRTSPHRSQ